MGRRKQRRRCKEASGHLDEIDLRMARVAIRRSRKRKTNYIV